MGSGSDDSIKMADECSQVPGLVSALFDGDDVRTDVLRWLVSISETPAQFADDLVGDLLEYIDQLKGDHDQRDIAERVAFECGFRGEPDRDMRVEPDRQYSEFRRKVENRLSARSLIKLRPPPYALMSWIEETGTYKLSAKEKELFGPPAFLRKTRFKFPKRRRLSVASAKAKEKEQGGSSE